MGKKKPKKKPPVGEAEILEYVEKTPISVEDLDDYENRQDIGESFHHPGGYSWRGPSE